MPVSRAFISQKHYLSFHAVVSGSTPKNRNHYIFFCHYFSVGDKLEIISGVIIRIAVRPRLFRAFLLYVLRKR